MVNGEKMNYFKLASPYGKMPDDKIWQGINGDPTMKREEYVFVRKPVPSFEQIWDVFAKTNNKTERLGCASLFYFKHFHNYEYIPGTTILERSSATLLHRTHSMFGLLYYYGGLNNNGLPIVETHPDNPIP